MKRIIENLKRIYNPVNIILATVFVAQIVFLIVANIIHMDAMVDYDSSCALVHAMEVWNQKSLLLKEYGYQTTIDLDSIVWLVALLYGFTKNILLSQAIANCFIILVYVYVLERVFRRLGLSDLIRITGMLCYFIPYTLGQLGYAPMLFTAGAFYTIRSLLPLLLISILLDLKAGAKWNSYIVRLAYLFIMIYFAGLSSGVYVILCGILPIIVAEIILAILDDDINKVINRKFILSCIVFILGLIGVISESFFGLSTKASQMMLVSKGNWLANIGSYFVGIFELFGGVATSENVLLMSKEGIFILINWALISLALISLVYTIIKSIKNKKLEMIDAYCISIFAVNFFVLTLLFTTYGGGTFEYRYHLIPMLPVFILLSRMMNDILTSKNKTFAYCFSAIYILMVFISLVTCDKTMNDGWINSNVNAYKELKSELEAGGFDNVVFVGNSNITRGRVMRAFVPQMNCIITDDDWHNFAPTTWGGTCKALDNYMLEGKTAIIASPESWEALPTYLKRDVTVYKEEVDFIIYQTDNNAFDFISGFSQYQNKSIDFPYSPGYRWNNADIDENGIWVSNGVGGIVLFGPYSNGVEGKWNITIDYEIRQAVNENDIATFSVTKDSGTQELGVVSLEQNCETATIENIELHDDYIGIENIVGVPDGMIIEIHSITMEKVK